MGLPAENIWSDAEREAWRPPDPITVADHAAKYRVLDAKNHAEPGPWQNARAPYLREIMDAMIDPAVEEITFMASTQVGKSAGIENMLGYVVDQDPGPALLVQAREDDVYSFAHNRLRSMFQESRQLRRHCPGRDAGNLMQKEFRFDRMTVYFAGSNSPAALARIAIRYLFLDETDKYPAFSGREASPIELARERTRTFWNRKIFKSSTPTTKNGYIYNEYQRSDQRKYYVPCPHCGHYQILYFDNIRIPEDERDPGRIREHKLAWYECPECRQTIKDNQKEKMLNSGRWVSRGQTLGPDGEVNGEQPAGNHAGFWINCLYSAWLTWSEIMAKFLESRETDDLLMNFINSWLADIWTEKAEYQDSTQMQKRRVDYPAGQVPPAAVVLTAGVDVQKHFFYYVVRAWGPKMRSWLVDEGQLPGEDWGEIEERILGMEFPVMGEDEKAMSPLLVNIDSGYRTDEVYDFCRFRPGVRPIKGASGKAQRPYWSNMVDVHPVTGKRLKRGVRLWLLDTDYFKDFIFRRMALDPENDFAWLIHKDVSLEYIEQIVSEQKVTVKKGRHEVEEWQPKKAGRANHLWDAEVYAAAAAHMLKKRIDKLVRKQEKALQERAEREALDDTGEPDPETKPAKTKRRRRPRSSWVQTGGGWV